MRRANHPVQITEDTARCRAFMEWAQVAARTIRKLDPSRVAITLAVEAGPVYDWEGAKVTVEDVERGTMPCYYCGHRFKL